MSPLKSCARPPSNFAFINNFNNGYLLNMLLNYHCDMTSRANTTACICHYNNFPLGFFYRKDNLLK